MLETLNYIKSKTGDFAPEIGVVLGSGLGELGDESGGVKIPYCEIPEFKAPSIKGHSGNLVFCEIEGKKCVLMQGRYHYYEGYPMQTVVFPIRVMKKLGVKTLILTNAAGGINPDFKAGDLMLITDHINLMGSNPLIGKNNDELGERFPDMSEIYKKRLIELAKQQAQNLGIELKEGVYCALSGPSYDTPAEVRMMRIIGADVCGMSTVPEAIAANHAGIEVLGISCVTNMAAGISKAPLNHAEVIETANKIKENFKKLIKNTIKNT